MPSGADDRSDVELLAEQLDFYRADAEPFDRWLAGLLAADNQEATARTYRAGRARIARTFTERVPLGRVLEIAAGTGRLVDLYTPHAESVVLLDASPESLDIAAQRLTTAGQITFLECDVFDWQGDGHRFDTVVFTSWLHHVPGGRLEEFWLKVGSLLAARGLVIFDFPDANIEAPSRTQIPAEPSDAYCFYAPRDGISIRDRFGRRWRVVHNLWDPDDLSVTPDRLGWTMSVLGPASSATCFGQKPIDNSRATIRRYGELGTWS